MSKEGAFLDEAAAIGDRLAAKALWHEDRCAWVARQVPAPRSLGPPSLAPLDSSLYSGTAGVGLFLARLAAHTGSATHRRTAAGALRHALRRAWDREEAWPPDAGRRWRFGFYSGALGVAWSAVEASDLVEAPDLAHAGRGLVRDLAATLGEPGEHDVLAGDAGAIPALLDLAARGEPGTMGLARALGEGLLAAARRGPDGWSWPLHQPSEDAPRFVCGLSHGASGIGWALAALAGASREPDFVGAARAAFAYEDARFDAVERNWPDLRYDPGADGRPVFKTAWCHGAPGIGVARAMAAGPLRDAAVAAGAAKARPATAAALRSHLENPGRDLTPCCGMVGIAECLWLLDEALGHPGALDRARAVGAWCVERFGTAAQRRWPGAVDWPLRAPAGGDPALMTGLAGVGHFLLRLARPEVPTLLLPAARCVPGR